MLSKIGKFENFITQVTKEKILPWKTKKNSVSVIDVLQSNIIINIYYDKRKLNEIRTNCGTIVS